MRQIVEGVLRCPKCSTTLGKGRASRRRKLCWRCEHKQKGKLKVAKRDLQNVRDFVKEIAAGRSGDGASVATLAPAVLKRLGGMDGVGELWANQVRAAIDKNPGGKTATDAIKQLVDFLVRIDPVMQNVNELASMSEDEVKDQVFAIVMQRLDLETLRQMAADRGYALIDVRETIDGGIAGVQSPDPVGPVGMLDDAETE